MAQLIVAELYGGGGGGGSLGGGGGGYCRFQFRPSGEITLTLTVGQGGPVGLSGTATAMSTPFFKVSAAGGQAGILDHQNGAGGGYSQNCSVGALGEDSQLSFDFPTRGGRAGGPLGGFGGVAAVKNSVVGSVLCSDGQAHGGGGGGGFTSSSPQPCRGGDGLIVVTVYT